MSYYYSSQGAAGGDMGYKDTSGYGHATAVAMPAQVHVSVERKPWSWCATVWASLAFFLCPYCMLCNFISLMCLGHAYSDHKSGDHARKQYKKNCGVGWLVTSWVLGVAVIIAIIVLAVRGTFNQVTCTFIDCSALGW